MNRALPLAFTACGAAVFCLSVRYLPPLSVIQWAGMAAGGLTAAEGLILLASVGGNRA